MPQQRDPSAPHSRAWRGQGRRRVIVLPDETNLPVPRLPAGREWSAEDRRRWRQLWRSPMASMWDDAHADAVALYLTYTGRLLAGKGSAWMAAEARHLAAELGLTPRGMAALGWELSTQQGPATVRSLPGVRDVEPS